MEIEKALPEITIELGEEKLTVVFSLYAFCELERLTGVNALEGQTWDRLNATILSTLLWAGLITHKPDLTIEELRKSISVPTLTNLYTVIIEALAKASSGKKTEAAQEIPAANA